MNKLLYIALGLVVLTGVIASAYQVGLNNARIQKENATGTLSVTSNESTLPSMESPTGLSGIEGRQLWDEAFLTDGASVYYRKQVLHGWKEADVVYGDPTNEPTRTRTTDVTSTIERIPEADPVTFTVDRYVAGNAEAQPFVTETWAHDARYTYVLRRESWSCGGDIAGCAGDTMLIVRAK